MADGSAERIHCRAIYAVARSRRGLNQTLSCASDSYNLDITANVVSNGGGVSGSWSEATHSRFRNISGRANGADIQAYVSGAGFVASIGIRTHGDGQSVTIRPQAGTDVRAMSVTCTKDEAVESAIYCERETVAGERRAIRRRNIVVGRKIKRSATSAAIIAKALSHPNSRSDGRSEKTVTASPQASTTDGQDQSRAPPAPSPVR